MALHPSGSAREDVELVFIETEQFTLIIKGKPYHEKYEGLRQYRLLDVHEKMQFSIKGEKVQSVKVFDVEQQELVPPSSNVLFFSKMVSISLYYLQRKIKSLHFTMSTLC